MEHDTQVRCRDCATGWVIVNSQEDVPSASHRLCEACIRKVHSQRTERRVQEPKPRGKPPKKNSNRGNNDGDELAAQPPPPPPAPRRRGRPPKQRPNPTFDDSLHVTAHADQGGTEGDGDGDELAAQPPVPPPAIR